VVEGSTGALPLPFTVLLVADMEAAFSEASLASSDGSTSSILAAKSCNMA
jgi:hypothetical protein